MNLYMIIFYCSRLEEEVFHRRRADFLWMLLITAAMLLGLHKLLGSSVLFLSKQWIAVLTYVWGRKMPFQQALLFLFAVRAPYVVWILALLDVAFGSNPGTYLLGVLVGHVYFYLEDVLPHMPISKGFRLLKTPRLVQALIKN
ncbi:MAG: hypothetical protein KVP17_003234 [Porospora cf. gigantea B]|uniref:uncharacterized protein n=2 Tax=Porospora cf. gigantea B TaxID=2853592 RepID=UPI0035718FA5|nr:MAG: hypothetical protein KVP17_003234 [Porospora cf. gigantea B]